MFAVLRYFIGQLHVHVCVRPPTRTPLLVCARATLCMYYTHPPDTAVSILIERKEVEREAPPMPLSNLFLHDLASLRHSGEEKRSITPLLALFLLHNYSTGCVRVCLDGWESARAGVCVCVRSDTKRGDLF